MIRDDLDCVLAVAEEQNLTRAARKLFMSQPSLTAHLNRLEEELGVRLFDRTVSPVRITRAGSLYIRRMKEIQRQSDCLVSELRQLATRETVFTFGIGSTRGSHWLPSILPEFCALHPHVTLQLQERGEDFLEDGVRRGEIDLAVGALNTSYPELTYEDLAEEVILLAIPRSYPCVSHLKPWEATPSSPCFLRAGEVGTIPFLLPYPGSGFYRCATMLLEQAGLQPGREVRYGNMNTAYQLAGRGVGALFLTPALFLTLYPEVQSSLAFCSLQNPPFSRRSVAGFRPEHPRPDLIQDMIRLIRERVLPDLDRQNEKGEISR